MTDFKDDDNSSSVGSDNFKERILRELKEEANRKRQLQEEEAKRKDEEERQAEMARRQKEREEARLAKEHRQNVKARQAAKAARKTELDRVQSEQEINSQNQKNVQQKPIEQEFLIQEAIKSPLESSETPSQMSLSSERGDYHLGEDSQASATSAEATETTNHRHLVDSLDGKTKTQRLPSDSHSSSEMLTKEVASASLSKPSQTASETTQETSSSSDSLLSSVVPSTAENRIKEATAASQTVTEEKVSERLEEQNEAVVAEIEAKESITEVKQSPMNRKKKNHKIAAKITGILVTIILVVALLTAFLGYRYVSSSLGAVDSDSKKFVTVQIPEGSGNKLIGQILEENGLVKNASIFNYYTRFKNVSELQSGYYNLQKNMTVQEIIDALKEGGTSEPQEPVSGKILVTEGFTIDQIAKAVTTNVNTKKVSKTPYSEKDFLDLMKNRDFIDKMVKKYPELLKDIPSADKARYQLEGYLFPATYNYYEDSTLEEIVDQMLATMHSNLAPYYDQIAAKGHTVNDILTLASLVEKEGSTDDDRRQIASVFYNRLSAQMPLQSNIAILYAMGKLGQETTLREDATIDTKINSPYNIYENPGLMPGPVDSPGLSAIEATVNPADSNNLYFVADVTTGEVYYAEDYATHEANVSKYVNAHLDK
ncbi:endolytic transglycosylase MltG [Streptococcus halotolerans]|uniref:endolytic transglycosylase MltG n=1 Tax=Streptococcus halotolerans TaxID=1814128 RepID=UPI000787E8AC|nr:endolytic transglycosylase MltG [Streptococcus halotolerans]